MPQGALPFQYESAAGGYTALAGLPAYLDLARVLQLAESVERHVEVRRGRRGYHDAQMILALILLNLAGGDCVDDLDRLEADEGFARLLRRIEDRHLPRGERRERERRFRRRRDRSVPSPSAMRRYLREFHDPEQERLRATSPVKAFIPAPNTFLRGLFQVNADLLAAIQRVRPESTATLDGDATVLPTYKLAALYSYKKVRAFQPLNFWWAEQGVIVHSEFRDGNVPAGYEQLRVLKQALELLPPGVEEVLLRADTAGYEHELLAYLEAGEHPRFGRIEFAVGCDVSPEFKAAVLLVEPAEWKPVYEYAADGKTRKPSKREVAEVCFVPNGIAFTANKPVYRYLATREDLEEEILPGVAPRERPFPTIELGSRRYKLHGIVTNRRLEDAEDLVTWLYERCGKSEEAHAVMKRDLAGGKLPAQEFGANAAWWAAMILAHNLNAAMKTLILGKGWAGRRMKSIRFHLIALAGRVVEHARQIVIQVSSRVAAWLVELRGRIAALDTG